MIIYGVIECSNFNDVDIISDVLVCSLILPATFAISTCTARYGRYISVRQVIGKRTARYRAVLFSTETFAMGVNAPARTVSLSTYESLALGSVTVGDPATACKLDRIGLGEKPWSMCQLNVGPYRRFAVSWHIARYERYLSLGMSEESDLKQIMVGKPTRLESQFRLTYTMILHLLRVEELKSLHSFPVRCIKGEPAIEEYFEMASEAETHRQHILEAVLQSHTAQQFLSPGRVVVVKSQSKRDGNKYPPALDAVKAFSLQKLINYFVNMQIDVLKEIYCIDSDLVVQLKGRVACEMNSGEELICTECLFENQLDDLEAEEAVAIMSSLVFQQNNTSEPSLTPKLAHAKMRLYDTAIRLGQLQSQFKLAIDPVEYARENLKFGLVEVVYEWAKGTPFADICELTDVPEGLIVRTIVRLDETCREFKNAASIMGNTALYKKMETASNAIKRDIVFAASLYVTGV
ncbi:hypothetical protein GW17_00005648 [Ensete ventricosum]|nr:hypothetical protein GW17_00005648 [Ensete ventricosum]